MSSTMTAAGDSLRARLQAEGKPLVIDRFVFAHIPGQDSARPVNPAAGIPLEHVVHSYAIPEDYRAYINPDQVVYSAILGSDIGDFSFNWQGLVCGEYDTLVAVSTFPAVEKRAYSPDGDTPGNNVTRNFILQFGGARAATAITVQASTWQIDYTARLRGIDERERGSNRDIYGRAAFLDEGWKLTREGEAWRFEAGTAYVEGIRLPLAEALSSIAPPYPCEVWLDVSLEPDGSGVTARAEPLFLPENQAGRDYVGAPPVKERHYLEKTAHIDAAGNITDLRPRGPSGPALGDLARLSDIAGSMRTLETGLLEHAGAAGAHGLDAHLADYAAHGAAVTAAAGRLVLRDAAGRARVAAPADAADIANKAYVDGSKSLAAAGWAKLPGGLILQWGRFSVGVSSYSFPLAFPNACLAMSQMQAGAMSGSICRLAFNGLPGKTGFAIETAVYSNMFPATWIAIGY